MNSAERAGLRPKGNVPTLRFPEFSGEWLATTIDGVTSEFQSGKFIKADLIQSKGSVPVYGGNGLRGYTDTYNHIGDYVLIGRQGALCGNVRFVTGETYITEHAIAVKGTEDNDTKYLQYLFERMNLGQYSDQSAQPGLAVSKLIKLKITIPPKREQSKIARLLTVIDERITTQIRIINELQSLIIGLEQTLLKPQSSWTSCFIGDVLSIGSGRDYKHLSKGDIPVYGTGGYMLSVNDFLYDGESVCIGRKGTIDKPLYLHCKFWTVDTLFYTYDFREILPRYCYYLFNTINWLKYNEASGVPSLSKDTIERIKISIPSIEEQKRVCDIIDSVDEKLSLENTLLEKMISLKQFLLSSLFV